jgi:hypothetical protein
MKARKVLPSQQYLLEVMSYDPESGRLYWNTRPLGHFKSEGYARQWNKKFAGKIAGSTNSFGYVVIRVDSILYNKNRLVWKLVYGADPVNEIDHKNTIRNDDRLLNLREATRGQNASNSSMRSDNTSGSIGVSKVTYNGKCRATINHNGKQKNLGHFIHQSSAILKYIEKSFELHEHFARF